MKKRNCRKTGTEREQHERATRVRKMTDAQLCEYLDGLSAGTDDGLRISDATIRKIRDIAQRRGFLPSAE